MNVCYYGNSKEIKHQGAKAKNMNHYTQIVVMSSEQCEDNAAGNMPFIVYFVIINY